MEFTFSRGRKLKFIEYNVCAHRKGGKNSL